MKTLEQIENESRAARIVASARNLQPYVFFNSEEVDGCPPFPFPYIGDYEPWGWTRITDETLFADMTGFGYDDEPALSVPQLKRAIQMLLEKYQGQTIGFAITEVGEYQCYVDVFRKD